jgi:hypothetical protein
MVYIGFYNMTIVQEKIVYCALCKCVLIAQLIDKNTE